MLKKLIAASAVFMLFACSSDDNFAGDPSSASQGEEGPSDSSSSSELSSSSQNSGPATSDVLIASFSNNASALFSTYAYGYTLKGNSKENLTPFWNTDSLVENEDGELVQLCPIKQTGKRPDPACELDKTNAILQNTLSNQNSDLNYLVTGTQTQFLIPGSNNRRAILLQEYNLKANGDQASLGLNASDDNKSIGDLAISSLLNGTLAGFSYKYAGGAHEFRAVSKNDNNFWYVKILKSAKAQYTYDEWPETVINISEFKGNGSFAESGTKAETPFNLSDVAKFLWVVEYDAEEQENNTGSLMVHSFNAKMLQ